ncbi:MAG: hypothetical protein ABW192_07405 [Sphingobium sp.]
MMDGEEPLYMPAGEAKLWQALLVLTQELSVARDRIDLLERGLAARDILADGALESLTLDAEASAERAAARRTLVNRIMKPLRDA